MLLIKKYESKKTRNQIFESFSHTLFRKICEISENFMRVFTVLKDDAADINRFVLFVRYMYTSFSRMKRIAK